MVATKVGGSLDNLVRVGVQMTLEYIDPDLPRIKAVFQSIWSGIKPAK